MHKECECIVYIGSTIQEFKDWLSTHKFGTAPLVREHEKKHKQFVKSNSWGLGRKMWHEKLTRSVTWCPLVRADIHTPHFLNVVFINQRQHSFYRRFWMSSSPRLTIPTNQNAPFQVTWSKISSKRSSPIGRHFGHLKHLLSLLIQLLTKLYKW